MTKLMISNLQITGKEKAHTFITHTSLRPELGGVRQLGPHSCHLRGQRPCQASLPLQAARSKACMSPSIQPSAQGAKAQPGMPPPLEGGDLLGTVNGVFTT